MNPIVGAPFTMPGFIPAEHPDDERDPDNDPDRKALSHVCDNAPDQEGPDDGL